jgi:hypothetical protein
VPPFCLARFIGPRVGTSMNVQFRSKADGHRATRLLNAPTFANDRTPCRGVGVRISRNGNIEAASRLGGLVGRGRKKGRFANPGE